MVKPHLAGIVTMHKYTFSGVYLAGYITGTHYVTGRPVA